MFLKALNEEQIEEELKKHEISKSELKSKVIILKEWLKQQPHLPQYMSKYLIIMKI